MSRLSKYVLRTTNESGDLVYLHTITQIQLPLSATESDLKSNLFLPEDDRNAIERRLFQKHDKTCSFTIVPTWECSLRCSHCTVLNLLKKEDKEEIDIPKLINFLTRFLDYYSLEEFNLSFIGGEGLLRAKNLIDLMDAIASSPYLRSKTKSYNTTTNLACVLDETHWDYLLRLDSIAISLDGMPQEHNQQRKSIDGSVNPFWQTFNNLKELIKRGLRDRITVQAAMRDEYCGVDYKKQYYKMLMKIGIPLDKIHFGCIHPTERNNTPNKTMLEYLASDLLTFKPCCKYRPFNFTISKSDVGTDYYTWQAVGTLDDPIEVIDAEQKKALYAMPALQDEKCMSCPVLGYCWGKCTHARAMHSQPSQYCNQEKLIAKVNKMAANGELLKRKTHEHATIH